MSTARSSSAGPVMPPVSTLPEMIADLIRAMGSLFEITSPQERERLMHGLLLAAILCAGTWVRFWGLGNVGLHGDEETMAMAARHILQDGVPTLPSGMLYPRGLTQLYLMALSVLAFGESEWAWRLPSAVCGVALIALAYLAGRRFLRPQWNLAFAASIAFLPDLIEYSQTARMYIFLLASIAGSMACIFAWERTGRLGWLAGAVLVLVLGVELQSLAVTSVLLFLFPGLLQGDRKKIAWGLIAAGLVMLAFVGIDAWVTAQYPVPPPEYAADLGPPPWDRSRAVQGFDLTFDLALWSCGVAVAFFAFHLSRVITHRVAAISVVALLLGTLLAQLMLYYHLAGILFISGVVVARRYAGPRVWRRLSIFTLGSALLGLIHVSLLASTPGSVVKLLGAMVGQPSVWPYARIMEFSHVAGIIAVAVFGWGLVRIATRRPAADYWLLALLGVWIPLFAIGLFLWNVPSRYTAASILPLLVCAFGGAQQAVQYLASSPAIKVLGDPGSLRWLHAGAAALTGILVIGPLASARAINSGYATHPDHKGAAQFVRTLGISEDDIVLAEDVLQQTYYLGKVDYWLNSRKHARQFVERVDDRIVDFYTGTPVIGSGAELELLLRRHAGQRIIVIGSGENQADGRRSMRSLGIFELLASDRFQSLYTGRDGVTEVWRAVELHEAGPARKNPE